MRSYEQAWAAALGQSPFSNGTEGSAWEDNWCGRCVNDRGMRDNAKPGDEAAGCALLRVAIQGRTPLEWIAQRDESGSYRMDYKYACTEFRIDPDQDEGGPGGDPDPDPFPPVPVVDGQEDLFGVLVADDAEKLMTEIGRLQPVGAGRN